MGNNDFEPWRFPTSAGRRFPSSCRRQACPNSTPQPLTRCCCCFSPVFFSAKVLCPTWLHTRQGWAHRDSPQRGSGWCSPCPHTPPRTPAQPPWSIRAPVPLTKHAAPSWDRAGRSLLWGHGPRGASPSPSRDTPGSVPGVPEVTGCPGMFSLFSIPDLPPAQLISAQHRSGMETAPAPGEVCSPCVYT